MYLTVITTILVITQIIRVTQNAINLQRERKIFDLQCKELRDMEVSKEDFEMQRKAYKLIVEHFENANIPSEEI